MNNTFFLLPFDEERANKITELGQVFLKEIRDYVEKHGVPIMDKTEYKEIGGVVYPVTTNCDGIIIFDYPLSITIKTIRTELSKPYCSKLSKSNNTRK